MDLEKYKAKLEEERDRLVAELSTFAVPDKETPGDWDAVRESDPGATGTSDEVADQLEDMNERKATEGPLERQLAKVNKALERIESGTYGTCEVSGEPIEDDRLDANPSARTCKAHMEEEEGLPL